VFPRSFSLLTPQFRATVSIQSLRNRLSGAFDSAASASSVDAPPSGAPPSPLHISNSTATSSSSSPSLLLQMHQGTASVPSSPAIGNSGGTGAGGAAGSGGAGAGAGAGGVGSSNISSSVSASALLISDTPTTASSMQSPLPSADGPPADAQRQAFPLACVAPLYTPPLMAQSACVMVGFFFAERQADTIAYEAYLDKLHKKRSKKPPAPKHS
jgi:hypothetical protein